MGRSNAGKKQEEKQLTRNNANEDKDRGARDKSVAAANAATDQLAAEPGFRASDMTNWRGEESLMQHGLYGDLAERVGRHNAATGHMNDAGFASQLGQANRDRSMMIALGQLGIEGKQAQAVLDTRRMIPSFRMAPAGIYNQSAGGLNSNTAGLINGRMEQDSKPTFLQQLALAGVQAGGAIVGGGTGAGGAFGCWIAEALWGENDDRTHLVRMWLREHYRKTPTGEMVCNLYVRFGQSVAKLVRKSRFVRGFFQPIFNRALHEALGQYGLVAEVL